MITKNNWLDTNLEYRSVDKDIDFEVTLNLYKFTTTSFTKACEDAANEIAGLGKQIYIAFSGGADSEYVVRLFKRLNIPFIPVTVRMSANYYELAYVEKTYKDLGITNQVYIDMTDAEYLAAYNNDVVKKMNSRAINCVAGMTIAKYVKEQGGLLIVGEHILGIGNDSAGNLFPGFYEWDYFYSEVAEYSDVIPFFLYDLPIVHAMVQAMDKREEHEYKTDLYGVLFRPVLSYHYNRKLWSVIDMINKAPVKQRVMQIEYSKEQFMSLLTPWIIT